MKALNGFEVSIGMNIKEMARLKSLNGFEMSIGMNIKEMARLKSYIREF